MSLWLRQLCSASPDENRLLSALFDPNSYNRQVRPVTDHRKPVLVDVRLSLVEIIGLDEATGRLTLKLHLNLVGLHAAVRIAAWQAHLKSTDCTTTSNAS